MNRRTNKLIDCNSSRRRHPVAFGINHSTISSVEAANPAPCGERRRRVSKENPQSFQGLTYRVEVSPSGAVPTMPHSPAHDLVALLQILINLQSQTLEAQRQSLELQRQQLELAKETVQVAREQRARQISELERWQASHSEVLDACRESVGQLEQVHAALMRELTEYIADNQENLVEGDFALTDFVDRFGPRLAHLNTMLAVLRPLTLNLKPKAEG
jgi:hypothetical protein